MTRLSALAVVCLLCCATPGFSQKKEKPKPNINFSKEYDNVIYSPSADSTPKIFRSVLQMEIVIEKKDEDAQIRYANGTVVGDGLLVTVLDEPDTNTEPSGGIQSASLVFLDGSGAPATLVSYDSEYGVAVFKTSGLDLPQLKLSKAPPVANRRLVWHANYRSGRNTILYSRPLSIHKAEFKLGGTDDLVRIIDLGTSALSAERSGSPLLAFDGTVVGIMGRHKHWDVSPKNVKPRLKLAWAVPAHVIARLLEKPTKR